MSNKAICDVCGFKFPAERIRQRWDGYMVCKDDWEPRHIQDFNNPRRADPKALPFTRPQMEGADVGVAINTDTQTDIPTGTFTTNNSTL